MLLYFDLGVKYFNLETDIVATHPVCRGKQARAESRSITHNRDLEMVRSKFAYHCVKYKVQWDRLS